MREGSEDNIEVTGSLGQGSLEHSDLEHGELRVSGASTSFKGATPEHPGVQQPGRWSLRHKVDEIARGTATGRMELRPNPEESRGHGAAHGPGIPGRWGLGWGRVGWGDGRDSRNLVLKVLEDSRFPRVPWGRPACAHAQARADAGSVGRFAWVGCAGSWVPADDQCLVCSWLSRSAYRVRGLRLVSVQR